jgi:hypothetical protein
VSQPDLGPLENEVSCVQPDDTIDLDHHLVAVVVVGIEVHESVAGGDREAHLADLGGGEGRVADELERLVAGKERVGVDRGEIDAGAPQGELARLS